MLDEETTNETPREPEPERPVFPTDRREKSEGEIPEVK